MTTATSSAAPQTTSDFGRITRIMKLHLVNKSTTIGVPWIVLGFILLVNLAIWFIIQSNTAGADRKDAMDGLEYSGASFYIFVYVMVVAIQAINTTFMFALGYGVTRRDFYLGTSLTFALLSVMYGAALTILSYIEEWTNWWGLGAIPFS